MMEFFVPLCASSFPYGLMNLHNFCQHYSSASLRNVVLLSLRVFETTKEINFCLRDEVSLVMHANPMMHLNSFRRSVRVCSSLKRWIAFVWGWALIYFPIQLIIQLNRLWFCCIERRGVLRDEHQQRKVSIYGEGGSARMNTFIVVREILRSNVYSALMRDHNATSFSRISQDVSPLTGNKTDLLPERLFIEISWHRELLLS